MAQPPEHTPTGVTERRRNRRPAPDSVLDAAQLLRGAELRGGSSAHAGQLKILGLAVLLAILALFGLARWLAAAPALDASWTVDDQGELVLVSGAAPSLEPFQGRQLQAARPAGAPQSSMAVDGRLLSPSTRWLVDATRQQHQTAQLQHWRELLAHGSLQLRFDGNAWVEVHAKPRGTLGLGLLFWPLATVALLLPALAIAQLMRRAQLRNVLYLLISLGAGGNLLFVAVHSLPGLFSPPWPFANDLPWRVGMDGLMAAGAVHALTLHPRSLGMATWLAGGVWGLWAGWAAWVALAPPPYAWWGTQALLLLSAVAAAAAAHHSHRQEPNPVAVVLRRLCLAGLGVIVAVSVGVSLTARLPDMQALGALWGAALWALFAAGTLLILPYLPRSRRILTELALLGSVSAVTMALNVLFVGLFALGPQVALALALFLSLGLYGAARQWLASRQPDRRRLSTERAFEQLYRVTREAQSEPARRSQLLGRLLGDLFEPSQVMRVERHSAQARVVGAGAALLVPLAPAVGGPGARGGALLLRFARKGQRLFDPGDAQLADRLVEQLRRAVAYDKAVERGRSEERQRIAQDLHDDIGARLLTLMYQARTPEMEEYIRHTLQDLKTLTRGLAASEHRFSHAAAEWKSDMAQRLSIAQVELGWSFQVDQDLRLSVVQWSALTRILRELISNALYHAGAGRVDVRLCLEQHCLTLSVADDGRGRAPLQWSQGLGLGGVRKRVKLLGGQVQWRENQPKGVVCELTVPNFGSPG